MNSIKIKESHTGIHYKLSKDKDKENLHTELPPQEVAQAVLKFPILLPLPPTVLGLEAYAKTSSPVQVS